MGPKAGEQGGNAGMGRKAGEQGGYAGMGRAREVGGSRAADAREASTHPRSMIHLPPTTAPMYLRVRWQLYTTGAGAPDAPAADADAGW